MNTNTRVCARRRRSDACLGLFDVSRVRFDDFADRRWNLRESGRVEHGQQVAYTVAASRYQIHQTAEKQTREINERRDHHNIIKTGDSKSLQGRFTTF